MFQPALLTPTQQLAHAVNVPFFFLESGEQYQLPDQTHRQRIISNTVVKVRAEFEKVRARLLPLMVVDCTPKDISDVINCGLCHVFARIVAERVGVIGLELQFTGDPFHVWLYDAEESVNYDSFYAVGTRYRAELDGGYSLVPQVVWSLDRICKEFPAHEELYTTVTNLIKD